MNDNSHFRYWERGQRVRVVQGALSGFEGIVVEHDEHLDRVTVELLIFGRTTPAEVWPYELEAIT